MATHSSILPAPRRPAPAMLPVPSQPQWGSPEHNWDRPPPTAIGVSTRAARVDPAPGALPARVQPQWRPPRAQLGCPPPLRHDRTPDPRPPPPAARVHPAPGAIPARFQPQWPPPRAQLGPPPIPATTRLPMFLKVKAQSSGNLTLHTSSPVVSIILSPELQLISFPFSLIQATVWLPFMLKPSFLDSLLLFLALSNSCSTQQQA